MIEGLLLANKASGPTSHDIVAEVRRILDQPRVGHAGTLDPMASGLLPLVLGRATRLVRFLPDAPKVYEGTIELGWTSTTDDATGEATARHDGPLPAEGAVLEAAALLTGRLRQVPPAYSARKVGGTRLYRLARKGRAVSAPASEVVVSRFDLTPTDRPAAWRFVADVSAGTYLRALARDLGAALGCGGVLARLERRAIASMRLDDAVPVSVPSEVPAEELVRAVVPLEAMPLVPIPVRLVDSEADRRFRAGSSVARPEGGPADGLCRVLDASGALLGIGEIEGEVLRPRVVLPPRT